MRAPTAAVTEHGPAQRPTGAPSACRLTPTAPAGRAHTRGVALTGAAGEGPRQAFRGTPAAPGWWSAGPGTGSQGADRAVQWLPGAVVPAGPRVRVPGGRQRTPGSGGW